MPRLSVVWKFNLWVLGGLVILLGSAIAFGASEMSGLGESRVRLALTGAGTAASLVLEGAAALTPEATEGEAYQKTLAVLKRAVATFGLSDLYVLRPRADDPKTWEFLYDVKDGPFAEGKGKESGFEAYEDPPAELAQAWASADPVVTSEPYTDAYGTYRSSFLAVPDGAGKPAVVVGADFDLAQLADARKGEVVFVIVLALGGAAFLLALSWVSSRIIGRPLKTISGRFQGLARGTADLTLGLKVGGGDELADLAGAFNEFLEKLRFLVADLQMGVHETYRLQEMLQKESGDTVDTVAHTKEGARNLDVSGKRVESSVREVLTRLEAIEGLVAHLGELVLSQQQTTGRAVADQATLDGAAGELRGRAEDVAGALADLDRESEETGRRMEAGLKVLAQLKGAVEAVTGITATLGDTADATSLLAMNAGIEAAHAGPEGRGFSVIAQRMRQQAETSRADSERIGQTLGRMVSLIGEAAEAVEATSRGVLQTRQRIGTTVGLVGRLTESGDQLEGYAQRNRQAVEALQTDCQGVAEATGAVADQTREITARVRVLSQVSQEVVEEAGKILAGSLHMSDVVDETRQVAGALTSVSRSLEDNLHRFKTS